MPKISFVGIVPVEDKKIQSNREHCKSLGLPQAALGQPKKAGKLAVCGGGPSLMDYVEKLKEYEEVWAINGACKQLVSAGVDAWLFAADPHHIVAKWAEGAKKAILCDRSDPSVFEALKDAEVRVYTLLQDGGEIICGSSTATVAFHLGVESGFAYIDFFGCESSFNKSTHAYQNEDRKELLWVECGGKEYKTAPDFYIQAVEMSAIIKHFPAHYKAFGGGLLQAMIDNEDHDIPHVSRAFMEHLKACQSN